VRLWTEQSLEAWAVLDGTGVLHASRERAGAGWLCVYDWMAGEMRRRIGPPPRGATLPLWTHALLDGSARRPRMRETLSLLPGSLAFPATDVFAEIEVPVERLLFSDFHLWDHGPILGWYADPHEDVPGWAQKLLSLGVNLDNPARNQPRDPAAAGRIRASWAAIFNPRWMKCCVQATLWEIRREDVCHVERVCQGPLNERHQAGEGIRWRMPGKGAGAKARPRDVRTSSPPP